MARPLDGPGPKALDVERLKSLALPTDPQEGKGDRPMRRIAVVNLKGGTGKSTTATALAVGLARRGKRVLFVDCDAQANATWTLTGGQGADPPTLAEVLMRQAPAEDAIRPTRVEGLEILPGDASLSGVNVSLVPVANRDIRLRSALGPLGDRWDFVILDTAPTVTSILVNALVYAAEVVVPVDPGMYALLGLVQLETSIAEVREAYGNEALRLTGLLMTRVRRDNVCRDVEAELRSRFGRLVYEATIPLSAKIEEAHTRGQTIAEYAPASPGGVAYERLVTEVLDDGRAQDGGRGDAVGSAPVEADAGGGSEAA